MGALSMGIMFPVRRAIAEGAVGPDVLYAWHQRLHNAFESAVLRLLIFGLQVTQVPTHV